MENQPQAKKVAQVRQLRIGDTQAVLTLLQDRALATSAGLQLMPDLALQRWAVQNWLQHDEMFGIWDSDDLIGLIAIFDEEVGYFIQPSYQGRGIMTSALATVQKLTTNEMLHAEVALNNHPSQRVLIKDGFVEQQRTSHLILYQWKRKRVP